MENPAPLATVDTSTAVLLALCSTLVLAALHLLASRIRKLPLVPQRATVSFAGGLAVSYVFLHLLPELAEGNENLKELFGEGGSPTPLLELGIFFVALVGFCLFYGLERLAERVTGGQAASVARELAYARTGAGGPDQAGPAATVPPAAADPAGSGDRTAVFWLHLGSYLLYNFVITYTLPLTYRTGVAFAVLFTVAMGLHFVLSDRGLEEHYGAQFDRPLPRLLLAGALLVGWGAAALFAPTHAVTVSVLTAFLAGSVLLNVFKEEIPAARSSSLAWFLTGLGFYAALLATITYLGEG
ncbi:hypothetical protein [Nocardioides mesophilus]|uniref:ZIP family metal transporter n=1 Tax=Nocardioides mesophilus TaxID=433659 RepID=A0A7G9RCY5_9ACTN|nr:hypothetical protein [Nocardioides mesophilus]QNN53460.1 hypothetical protein H9L09_03155 [Nocardioides mesophilus]